MAENWSEGLPDDMVASEAEEVYMSALSKMREGLARGFDFNSAAATITIPDASLRQAVLDDVLKVLLAEEHFVLQVPLDQISRKLNLPLEQLKKAQEEMLDDIEQTTSKALHLDTGQETEH